MPRRSIIFNSLFVVLAATGCIKDTYDMNKLSKKMHISPTLAISAVKGNVSFSDIVKSSDTVIFDQNNFVKVVFKEDSVIELKMTDFYDLDNMISFNQTYTLGDLSLSPFQYTIGFTLREIIAYFSPPLKAQFEGLDDGSPHPFPTFPLTDIGDNTFSFTNFDFAVFKSGFIDISVTNNLPAPVNSISVKVFNTSGHTPIGDGITIPPVEAGQTQTTSIDLADETVTNSIIAAIIFSGSPGNPTPAIIDLDNSNIQVNITGRDLIAKSGRVIIPEQTITSDDNKDTLTLNPGSGIELNEFKTTTGNLSYHLQSTCPLKVTFGIILPTVLQSGIPLTASISINPNSISDGSIPVNNTVFNLASDPEQLYNRVPIEASFVVKSDGSLIDFNSTDELLFDLGLPNPVFDYIKGYFGQQEETIAPDSIEIDIEDILSHITGDFFISSPSITINYSNSFSIPVQFSLDAEGKKQAETIDLELDPFILEYPVAPANRDITSSFVIDKDNSRLPALISMPPEIISFSGTAKMNPAGKTTQSNYIFGESRIIGSVEVEVPLEFRMTNLQFTDTVNNFLKDNADINDSPFKPEDFEFLRIDLVAKNGFPLGVSVSMSLYDSTTQTIKSTIDATDILKPAPVDNTGKVTGVAETTISIEFTREFFSSYTEADKIIFSFTLNTTGNGTKDVKIYSDYIIDFKAALVLKPDIKLK